MIKKLQILFVIYIFTMHVHANEIGINFMLMNNYEVRQFNDLWQRMRTGFEINYNETKLIRHYEKFYSQHPKLFAELLTKAKPYLYFILTELERNGVPSEIALLPIIESSFNPFAITSANSAGLWQFMAITGTRFNLIQTKTFDERQDIVKSTRAAITYLLYLHKVFGQWDLAIGAYNWGEGNMFRSVRNSGQKKGFVEYNNLELRKVTEAYVPKLIALSNIIKNPSKFGIKLEEYPNQPYFSIIQSPEETSLISIIEQSETNKTTFSALNPQFKNNNYIITSNTKFLLPLENQQIFYASINQIQDNNNNLQLATNNNDNNDPIMQLANNDENPTNNETPDTDDNTTIISTPIKIAQNDEQQNNNNSSHTRQSLDELIDNISLNNDDIQTEKTSYINYIVKAGDTLNSIAKRFNISINELRKQNQTLGKLLVKGSSISIKLVSK